MAQEESHTILKLIIVLGIVFLLIGSLSPGADASWNIFATGVQNFPAFSNPFSERSWTFEAQANGTNSPVNIRGIDAISAETPGCDETDIPIGTAQWWGCLNTQDSHGTYITLGIEFGEGEASPSVYLDSFPDTSRSFLITNVTITYQCAGDGTNIPIFDFTKHNGSTVLFSMNLAADSPPTECVDDYEQGGSGFLNTQMSNHTAWDNTLVANRHMVDFLTSGAEMFVFPSGGVDTDLIQLSYVRVTVTYGVDSGCAVAFSGNPFDDVPRAITYVGCIIGAIGGFIIDFVTLIVNAITFIGEIILWFFDIVVSFIAVFAYIFAIPGAPPVVQGVITVVFIAIIGFIGLVMLTRARGSGTGA